MATDGSRGPVRVVVVAPTLGPAGGLVRFSRELVRGLELVTDRRELSIDVLVRGRRDYALQTVDEYGLQAKLHFVDVDNGSRASRRHAVQATARVLEGIRPDVIVVPAGSLWLTAWFLVRRRRVAVIAVAHGQPSSSAIPAHERRLLRYLARWRPTRTKVVANTAGLCAPLDAYVGLRPGTAISLDVGTDAVEIEDPDGDRKHLRETFAVPDDASVIAVVGRLTSGKRVEQVVDVLECGQLDRPSRVIVCGDGPEREDLVRRIERAELESPVHLLGHLSDPTPVLCGVDALLLPSESEGAPFVVIEALLCGVPVAAYDVGGVRDLLSDPADGQVAAGDGVADLAQALNTVLSRPASAASRQARAERARQRFSIAGMGRAYGDLVATLVDRPVEVAGP